MPVSFTLSLCWVQMSPVPWYSSQSMLRPVLRLSNCCEQSHFFSPANCANNYNCFHTQSLLSVLAEESPATKSNKTKDWGWTRPGHPPSPSQVAPTGSNLACRFHWHSSLVPFKSILLMGNSFLYARFEEGRKYKSFYIGWFVFHFASLKYPDNHCNNIHLVELKETRRQGGQQTRYQQDLSVSVSLSFILLC